MIRNKISSTVLLAIKNKKGKIMMAGDRRVSWGMDAACKSPYPKVIKRDNLLFAGTGCAYLCDLVVKFAPIPPFSVDESLYQYIHGTFYNSLVPYLQQKGILVKDEIRINVNEDKDDKDWGASILIGAKGELVVLDISNTGSPVAICPVALPFNAGCGGMYAIGAYTAVEKDKTLTDKQKLTKAIKIAAKYSPGCDANVDIIEED